MPDSYSQLGSPVTQAAHPVGRNQARGPLGARDTVGPARRGPQAALPAPHHHKVL